ncbi:MAG: DNRLRE domain-containing protein [candidate division Zixibacteria bacterium]|nr:DNRLRE domain-containing protein [candidate division Zixibacteria bacterium]
MKTAKRNVLLYVFILLAVMVLAVSCSDKDNPVIPQNHPPTKPVVDSPSGSPPNGSTNASITPTLRWKCSDPDSDKITYDLYFGKNNTPPKVSENQSNTNYATGNLEYSKKYYWKIVAKDSHGATTSSDVWSFTTKSAPVETISTPNKPTGVDSGEINQTLSYTTGGSTSSLGNNHNIQYQFDWNDGSYSGWSISTGASHAWSKSGTYNIKARAQCATHTDKISAWSNTKQVIINFPIQPKLAVSTNSLDFDSTHTSLTFNITNTGTGNLTWNISDNKSWIAVSPISGSTTTETDQVSISVDRNGLSTGTHTGTVTISSNGGTKAIGVSMVVAPDPPICRVEPTGLSFGSVQVGESKDMSFAITNTGGGTLSGSVNESCSHYRIISGSGSYNLGTGQSRSVNVRFAPTNEGSNNCYIEISSGCADVHCTGTGTKPTCDYRVTRPSSSDEWTIGETKTIRWDSENAGSYIRIELYKGSSRHTIDSHTANDGSYTWEVDDYSGGTDDNYRIKITDLSDSDCYDYSSYFDIDAGPWTVSCPVVADAHISSGAPNRNYGDAHELSIGSSYGANCAAFLKFDLSSIPENAKVVSANLVLYVRVSWGTFTVLVHNVSSSWNESTLTWNKYPGWWSTPKTEITIRQSLPPATLIIPVSDQVKNWVTEGHPNDGLVLKCLPWPGGDNWGLFTAKESGGNRIPKLSVTYTLD